MSRQILVRPATPADAEVGVRLIYMTMRRLADFLLGSGDSQRAKVSLSGLFVQHQNRFSHQFADIAEMDGRVVGLLMSYPSKMMKRLETPMVFQMLKILGFADFIRFVRNALPLSLIKEAGAGEHFINNVAVLPDFQGRGVGTHLLAFAEGKAKSAKLGICSLCVEIENVGARSLYERLGYRMVDTVRFKRLNYSIGYQGFHRMAKIL